MSDMTDERSEPQAQTLHPGLRYQFRGVFTIEHDEREPVEITWQRVVDDPYEVQLATTIERDEARRAEESWRQASAVQSDEVERLHATVAALQKRIETLTEEKCQLVIAAQAIGEAGRAGRLHI